MTIVYKKKTDVRPYLKKNENENTTHQNLWDAHLPGYPGLFKGYKTRVPFPIDSDLLNFP